MSSSNEQESTFRARDFMPRKQLQALAVQNYRMYWSHGKVKLQCVSTLEKGVASLFRGFQVLSASFIKNEVHKASSTR